MKPGTLFADRFRVVRTLSSGTNGTVCEATHELTRQRVVLKFIRAREGRSAGGAWSVRFRREVRAASALRGEHFVTIFDAVVDPEEGLCHLVMEYLDGQDADDLLRQFGRLSVDLALRIVAQACHGVQLAHEASVLHRDIKPGNLFLAESEDGRVVVKLLDFGLAKATAEGAGTVSHTEITEAGGVLGTPSYMSPEQAQGVRDIDVRSDVWSLGAVLHRMLTGRSVFERGERGPGEVLMELATGHEEVESVQSLAPWVPPEVAAIVHHALRRHRSERYESVQAMREDILALLPDDELTVDDLVPMSDAVLCLVAPIMTGRHLLGGRSVCKLSQAATGLPLASSKDAAGDKSSKGEPPSHRIPKVRSKRWPLVALLAASGVACACWVGAQPRALQRATQPLAEHSSWTAHSTRLQASRLSVALPVTDPKPVPAPMRLSRGPQRPSPSPLPKWTPPIPTPGF